MCIICIDWNKGLLTPTEAMRNFHELSDTLDKNHAKELGNKIQDAILEEALKELKDKGII